MYIHVYKQCFEICLFKYSVILRVYTISVKSLVSVCTSSGVARTSALWGNHFEVNIYLSLSLSLSLSLYIYIYIIYIYIYIYYIYIYII